MSASQVLTALNKAFKHTFKHHPYFSEWRKDGSHRFWFSSPDYCAGVELHIGKFWQNGGDFLIEVTAGHPISTDIVNKRFVSLKNGFYCVSRELIFVEGGDGTVGNDGRWITVNDEGDISAAMLEVVRLVDRDGIPWFENMKDTDAFTNWVTEHSAAYAVFPLTLALHGRSRVRDDVRKWIATMPRNVDDVISWLAKNSILDRAFCDRLRRATLQSDERYLELVVELAEDIRAAQS